MMQDIQNEMQSEIMTQDSIQMIQAEMQDTKIQNEMQSEVMTPEAIVPNGMKYKESNKYVTNENVKQEKVEKEVQPLTTEWTNAMQQALTNPHPLKYPCPICKNTTPILLYQHLYKIHGLKGDELKMWLLEARRISYINEVE